MKGGGGCMKGGGECMKGGEKCMKGRDSCMKGGCGPMNSRFSTGQVGARWRLQGPRRRR